MVLIKEIELALKPKSNEVLAQEDEILADSVLELANTDFTQADEYEDVAPGAIRKHVEADMRVAYPGKPTSRKRIFKDNLKADGVVKKGILKTDKKEVSDDEVSRDDDSSDKSLGDYKDDSNEDSGSGESMSDQDSDEENDLNSEFDGSILGSDIEAAGHGSDADENEEGEEVEDEEEIEGEDTTSKGIELFSSRARDINADIAKGKSIRNQLTIWENLIECRIKLQPSLINVNKLFQKDTFKEFKTSLSPEEEEVLLQTYSSLGELMKGLLELQKSTLRWVYSITMCMKVIIINKKKVILFKEMIDCTSISESRNFSRVEQDNLLNAVPSYIEMKSQKRKTTSSSDKEADNDDSHQSPKKKKVNNDLLQDIEEDFKPFRNASIQKWNEKTRVSSGKISKNDFSAFDLPTLKQIEEILLDQDRLLRRTRTKRSDYTILGKVITKENSEAEDSESKEHNKKKNQGEYDPEIFDDDDFYHKLLRDFIEKKTSDVTDISKRGKQWLELQKLRSQMKAKVDTRASKGRKLRFTVHSKMVNFMAPIPCFTWTDEAKNELFKSLFC